MIDHMSMIRELFGRFIDFTPGIVGLGGCESLFAHLKNKEIITEKVLVRQSPTIQQALEMQEASNVHWTPGLGNPADA